MAETWRPERIEQFVRDVSKAGGAQQLVLLMNIISDALPAADVSLVDADIAEQLAREWQAFSSWERLNAFLKVRDLVGTLAQEAFMVLNSAARKADDETSDA